MSQRDVVFAISITSPSADVVRFPSHVIEEPRKRLSELTRQDE